MRNRTLAVLIGCCALAFLTAALWPAARAAQGTTAPQTYTVGTSCDDAWQEGVFPAFPTSGINPSTTYKWSDAPVGWDGQGHIFNPGFRFENVQVAPHQQVGSARLSVEFQNDFWFVHELDVPIEVELGDAQDICRTNDIIFKRTFSQPLQLHLSPDPNGGTYTTIDVTQLVQQAVNSPSWHQGAALLVRLVGEDDRAEYPFSYGWNVTTWDAHDGFAPKLEMQT